MINKSMLFEIKNNLKMKYNLNEDIILNKKELKKIQNNALLDRINNKTIHKILFNKIYKNIE